MFWRCRRKSFSYDNLFKVGKTIVSDQNFANDNSCGEMKKASVNTREPGHGGTCTSGFI